MLSAHKPSDTTPVDSETLRPAFVSLSPDIGTYTGILAIDAGHGESKRAADLVRQWNSDKRTRVLETISKLASTKLCVGWRGSGKWRLKEAASA